MDHDHQSERDEWIYNHRDEIDPARYAQLQQQDADLDARLKALEASGKQRDPNYQVQGIDDLQYGDDAVQAVQPPSMSSIWPFPRWMNISLICIGIVGIVVLVLL